MNLLDVTPRPPTHDRMSIRGADAEALRQFWYRDALHVLVPHRADFVVRQFGVSAPFSSGGSTLLNHVVCVLTMCAQKQMFWIATRRVVASVAHKAGIVYLDRTARQLIRHAMRVCGSTAKPKLSITISADVADPQPTSLGFLNARPESSRCVGALVVVAAFLGAVLGFLRSDPRHRLAASLARRRHAVSSNSDSAFGVARMRTEATDFTRASHELQPTGDARAFHLRWIFPKPLMAFLIALKSERHICQV